MEVQFGTTFDDRRKVGKTITFTKTVNCDIYKESSITNPILILDASVGNVNYFYVPLWQRSYYITDIQYTKGVKMIVSGHTDVLQSFSAGIRNLNCTISRQENIGINDIVDTQLPLKNSKELSVIEFDSSEFNTGSASGSTYNFVLNVSGGGSGQSSSGGDSSGNQ